MILEGSYGLWFERRDWIGKESMVQKKEDMIWEGKYNFWKKSYG